MLKGLHIGREWVEEQRRIKEEMKDYFEARFKESQGVRQNLDGIEFNKFLCEDNSCLIALFGDVEVREAIWECGSSKSPGPDDFNFKFLKTYWNLLKENVMRFLVEFHEQGVLPRESNASFTSLIPKVEDPQYLRKFMPMSLVGFMYKILAKIVSNRLKKVLGGIIDQRQSTFLGGRYLLHSALVANEVMVVAKRKKCLIFKVDFEKAYDLVN